MDDKDGAPESVIELREEVLQRVEKVGSRIKRLSILTLFVSALLSVSYVVEIALPYFGGSATQTVNLKDPGLVAFEVFLTFMVLLWFFVGLSDYRFVSRLSSLVAKARAQERIIEKEITPGHTEEKPIR